MESQMKNITKLNSIDVAVSCLLLGEFIYAFSKTWTWGLLNSDDSKN